MRGAGAGAWAGGSGSSSRLPSSAGWPGPAVEGSCAGSPRPARPLAADSLPDRSSVRLAPRRLRGAPWRWTGGRLRGSVGDRLVLGGRLAGRLSGARVGARSAWGGVSSCPPSVASASSFSSDASGLPRLPGMGSGGSTSVAWAGRSTARMAAGRVLMSMLIGAVHEVTAVQEIAAAVTAGSVEPPPRRLRRLPPMSRLTRLPGRRGAWPAPPGRHRHPG